MAPRSSWRVSSTQSAPEGRIDVWLSKTDSGRRPDVRGRCRGILLEEELEVCSSFHQEADRNLALVARAHLRQSLSRHAPVDPRAWRFSKGLEGKPEIAGAEAAHGLEFNLSHTRALVACAVARGFPIGVDVEDTARELDPLELATRVFTPAESQALRALPPGPRKRRFFELWTLKEAWLKACGAGFSIDPRSLEFDLSQAGRVHARLPGEDSSQWWFAVRPIGVGHVLALAARCGPKVPRVRIRHSVPGDIDCYSQDRA
ncbi:MAG: 4'-phosphopantetheinyl transferase superfamily protein [Planctomycetes bacterium]|nr:4'-phosphopantetheinyl transferase superfamily protein [Planctomycetota bacterium]